MRAWTVELGVDAFPFLADHRLRGVIVLPGSAVVEMALAAAIAATGRRSYALDDVRLEQVCVIPTSGGRRLRVALLAGLDDGLAFTVASDPGTTAGAAHGVSGTRHATARITALTDPSATTIDVTERALNVRRTGAESSGEAFYTSLHTAGNDYGPAFRTLQRVWRRGDEAFALVHTGPTIRQDQLGWLAHPVLVDAAIQLLAAAFGVDGRAFVWASCDQVRVYDTLQADCQAYARVQPTTGSDVIAGDVVLLGSTGQVTVEITGVRLHFLRTVATRSLGEFAPSARQPKSLAVAATFDAEPLCAELGDWMAALGITARVVVDHNARAVSELTAPGGVLASNRDGVNLLLVRTEEAYGDVLGGDGRASGKRFTIPDVGEIAHLHSYETEFLYDEIFVHEAYLRHGVALYPGDIVFDVGANIGMFTLFVHHRCPGVRVYAFEPAQPAFEALRENAAQYCPDDHVFNYGISDGDRIMPFTYYRNSTVFSGFEASPERDAKTIRTVIENVLHAKVPPGSLDLRPIVDRMLQDRLVVDVHPSATKTLSTVFRETDIHRVDLLKIDTEGSEVQVLKGIEDQHWERIRQVVLEVHGRVGERDVVTALLEDRGFHVLVDQQEHLLRGTALTTVFARRPDDRSGRVPQAPSSTEVIGPSARRTAHLVQAVAALQRLANTPCIVCLCPSPKPDSERRRQLDRADQELATALAALPGVVVVTGAEIEQARREADSGQNGLFTALAKVAARAYLNLR